jgi:hypothetical protein
MALAISSGRIILILRKDRFQQFSRGLQDQIWFIGCDGGRAADSTDWHTFSLNALSPVPSPNIGRGVPKAG